MDGVLVDTEKYYLERRTDFFATHHIDASHMQNRDFIGGNMKDLWPKILGKDYTPKKAQQLSSQYKAYKASIPLPYEKLLFDESRLILEHLKKQNYALALASSSSMADIKKCLKIHKLEQFFSQILSGNDFKVSKPNPAIYQAAIQKLGVTPAETLIIEDSQNGIAAGKDAGATVWAIRDDRFGMYQERADCKLPSLTAIMQKLMQENEA